MIGHLLPSINHRALASARPIVSLSIIHIHQTQIKLAPDLSKYEAQDIQLADTVITELHRANPTVTTYPFQQDEVCKAVEHIGKTSHMMIKHNKSPDIASHPLQSLSRRELIWHAAMTAKYTGMMSPHGRSIAHGAYIPRNKRRKTQMLLNNDPAAELQWLS